MSQYYDEKAKERSNRYRKEKRDKLTIDMPKGKKEQYREFAEQMGYKSLTALIITLIENEIEKNGF